MAGVVWLLSRQLYEKPNSFAIESDTINQNRGSLVDKNLDLRERLLGIKNKMDHLDSEDLFPKNNRKFDVRNQLMVHVHRTVMICLSKFLFTFIKKYNLICGPTIDKTLGLYV